MPTYSLQILEKSRQNLKEKGICRNLKKIGKMLIKYRKRIKKAPSSGSLLLYLAGEGIEPTTQRI